MATFGHFQHGEYHKLCLPVKIGNSTLLINANNPFTNLGYWSDERQSLNCRRLHFTPSVHYPSSGPHAEYVDSASQQHIRENSGKL